jgi:hypothetical protein
MCRVWVPNVLGRTEMSKRWVAMMALVVTAGLALAVPAARALGTVASVHGIRPHHIGMMDCNGHSPRYKSVKPDMGGLCADPFSIYDGSVSAFRDNGVYIGHDEPTTRFLSSAPGSANNMTYVMRLSTDPAGTPTVSPTGPTRSNYAELSRSPWFGLPLCDPNSYPQNPCTPDSDANSGSSFDPAAAGSAFLEVQFYPPGYTPFIDGPSCTATQWCAALTIDSLECSFFFVTCNSHCIEPKNFAYLQLNGVPAGPPSPQLSTVSTFTPNGQTLLMNPGDAVAATVRDTSQGLLAAVTDLNTNQTGFMLASASNGFMNTSMADCSGTPFTFHPEYSSAQQQNSVPWASLEGGVLMTNEVGHFEPCSSVTNTMGFSFGGPDGQTFSDPAVSQTCVGGFEGAGKTGEGPCDPSTGICQNASTEGGAACPSNSFTSGAKCEYSDALCFPAGPRTIIVNGTPQTVSRPIAGCQTEFFQNGDLDFDGSSYISDWPDGSPDHPTSLAYIGPFTNGADTYPQIQFETNGPASEILCNVVTGAGCTVPPVGPGGPTFYPFWTLGNSPSGCVWNFGNVIPGQTVQSFGGAAEYGTPDTSRFAGTFISPVMNNPQFSTSCQPSSQSAFLRHALASTALLSHLGSGKRA